VRLLLDECLDRRLAGELTGHFVRTVPQMGWSGLKNGELLALAEQEFDAFITVDRNLPSQQHLTQFDIAVVVICVPSNRLADLQVLVPDLIAALPSVGRREATLIGERLT